MFSIILFEFYLKLWARFKEHRLELLWPVFRWDFVRNVELKDLDMHFAARETKHAQNAVRD